MVDRTFSRVYTNPVEMTYGEGNYGIHTIG